MSRVFLWAFEPDGESWKQVVGDTSGELLTNLTGEVRAWGDIDDGTIAYVTNARYADPAADFDIVDFFENQCSENMNCPAEEDWITYGISLEECAIITAEIQDVIRNHMRRLELDKAFAWTDGAHSVPVTFYGEKPSVDERFFKILGFPIPEVSQ